MNGVNCTRHRTNNTITGQTAKGLKTRPQTKGQKARAKMKAKTKKTMYAEMKNNLANNCKVFADSAGRFAVATRYGVKTLPKQLQSMVNETQAKSALNHNRISWQSPNDFDDFVR